MAIFPQSFFRNWKRTALAALSTWAVGGTVDAAIFRNGLMDHMLCCGLGGPAGFDGAPSRERSQPVVAQATPAVHVPAALGVSELASLTQLTAAEKAPEPIREVDGYRVIDFAYLSDFTLDVPGYDPNVSPEESLRRVDAQIPAAIKHHDGARVQVTGFMLPVKMDGLLVSEFLLMRDQMMCCYGVVPRLNDWIVVTLAKPVRYTPDVPVAFRGKFTVKAQQEQGFITAIYSMAEATPAKR